MIMKASFAWTHPSFEKAANLMEAKTGLIFPSHRIADVEESVRRAMARMKIREVGLFVQRLENEESFLVDLAAQLTVGESYFFRDPQQFQWIREKLLPEIIQRRGPHPLRAWSAGCSAGEEAYSLAILFEEAGIENHAVIQATDISTSALLKARKAVYSSWSLREKKDDWIDRYFRREPDGFALDRRFLPKVRFEERNLVLDRGPDSSSLRDMDLILCRNVMIYLSASAIEKVFRTLIASLAEGGWLVTGPSDPLPEKSFQCESILTPSGIAYRKVLKDNSKAVFFHFKPWTPSGARLPTPDFTGVEDALKKEKAPAVRVESPAETEPVQTAYSEILSKAQKAFIQMDYDQVLRLTLPLIQERSACVWLLRALANLKDRTAAEAAAEKAVRLHPLSPELNFLRAVLLMNRGKNWEAARDLRRTLYLDRSLAVAQFTLGLVLRRLQDWEGAKRAFKNSLKLCLEFPPESILRLSDGESVEQLREASQAQLSILEETEGR
jgi:chemotaxis protein methyltransferase CheR